MGCNRMDPFLVWAFDGDIFFDECVEDLSQAFESGDVERYVIAHAIDLPALSPIGFRSLLGAYLSFAVRHTDSEVADRLFLHLSGISRNDYWLDRVRQLTREQVRLLIDFLREYSAIKPIGLNPGFAESAIPIWEEYLARIQDN